MTAFVSVSFCLRPPNAAAVTGWLLSRLCSQHLQHGLSRSSCLRNTYRINAWAVKDKSRFGFRPHCPGLLCLGRWCWLCPLALPSHRAPSLLPVNRASPAGSAVEPTPGGICGPAPFSQNLIEEDAETFVVKHTPGSVCSLPPPLLLLASPFLEESAVKSLRWAGSAGCGQLCSSNPGVLWFPSRFSCGLEALLWFSVWRCFWAQSRAVHLPSAVWTCLPRAVPAQRLSPHWTGRQECVCSKSGL